MGRANDGRRRTDHLSGEASMKQLVPIFQVDGQRVNSQRTLPTVTGILTTRRHLHRLSSMERVEPLHDMQR